ncbi:uncharacterized protein LOC121413238 isoform X2 [Lytechinus variegatus]|uniref:uncharacterized protein LOC121413238 isoform X2 n=1 Tax=Lytechinus variegatus TaxID=7654 RepID=UPI001BB11F5C|nr:uncharacterized protein LOC121413238 isoform X2 [Lytechinus variegatus]
MEGRNEILSTNITFDKLSRPNRNISSNHLPHSGTLSFVTVTSSTTTQVTASDFSGTAIESSTVFSLIHTGFHSTNFPVPTFSSDHDKTSMKSFPLTEVPGIDHRLDTKTIMFTVVSAVGAGIFLSIFFVVLCNIAMYRRILRSFQPTHEGVNNVECKFENEILYEKPLGTENHLSRSILSVQETLIGKLTSDSTSSESNSILSSSNRHSDSIYSISFNPENYRPTSSSSDLSEPSGYSDERPSSLKSYNSSEGDENMYETVYDNQSVVDMHIIGKPRFKPTERNPTSHQTYQKYKHLQLPLFPKPIQTSHASSV